MNTLFDKPLSLVLFFTRGLSLRAWDTSGLLPREVALYQRLQAHGVQVSFVTYGGADDLDYRSRIPGIRILCNRWGLGPKLYERLIPLLHAPTLARCDVIKTNQTDGADVALRAARLWHKPLIARSGFLWSLFLNNISTEISQNYDQARLLGIEQKVFPKADWVTVTTPAMKEHIAAKYHVPPARISVIPNYMLTTVFAPTRQNYHSNHHIIFVGRLSPEKNLPALLDAIRGLDVELTLVGNGGMGQSLKQKATEEGLHVQFIENIPNQELPVLLNEADLFVQLSFSEGHPKTLLEAMSCGLPVIGADSPGIRELLVHRENGYLCGIDSASIRAAVQDVLRDETLREQMGTQARRFVIEHFDIEKVISLELDVLRAVRHR